MTDLYRLLHEAGCETDHHESDLYVKNTEESLRVIRELEQTSGKSVSRTPFRSTIDGSMWLDLPFQYTPFWEQKLSVSHDEAESTTPAPGM